MLENCVSFLSEPIYSGPLNEIRYSAGLTDSPRLQRPFLRYASLYWCHHLAMTGTTSDQIAKCLKVVTNFLDSSCLLTWIEAVITFQGIERLWGSVQALKSWILGTKASFKASIPDLRSLERWSIDLEKLKDTFGSDLSRSPNEIHFITAAAFP